MGETIRSVLRSASVCAVIFLVAQLLRTRGALSFLPESGMGQAVAALGTSITQEWSDGTVAVFAGQNN